MPRSDERVARGVAAGVVVLLHGLMIAAFMHALRLGYLVVPHLEMRFSANRTNLSHKENSRV